MLYTIFDALLFIGTGLAVLAIGCIAILLIVCAIVWASCLWYDKVKFTFPKWIDKIAYITGRVAIFGFFALVLLMACYQTGETIWLGK